MTTTALRRPRRRNAHRDRRRKPVAQRTGTIEIAGRPVALTMRRDHRASRIRLRIDIGTAGLIVTLPEQATEENALAFVASQEHWITTRLDTLPPPVPFAPGARVPLLGQTHEIYHEPGSRAGVRREDGADGGRIVVGGRSEDVAQRVERWLRDEAKRVLTERAQSKANRLGRPLGRITVRDTRTRWGSCSSTGNLSFCWRLIIAPAHVLDYVVAHEVAHLAERNHGPAFWRTAAALTHDVEAARAWLLRYGQTLIRYGPVR